MKRATAFAKRAKRFFGVGRDPPEPQGAHSKIQAALKPLTSRLPPTNTICVCVLVAYVAAAGWLLACYALQPAVKGKSGFKAKTFYQTWLSDKGAYPLMGVLVIASVMPLGFAVYKLATDPDARFRKALRKSILRSTDDGQEKAR